MLRELRIAFRALVKQPGFSFVAVLTIALGVGANAAIFTVVDAVMLRPLPWRDASRVVMINEHHPQFPLLSMSAENLRDACQQARTVESCGAFRNTSFNLSAVAEPERVAAKMIGASVLPMLGVSPVIGRRFSAADDAPGRDGARWTT